jgi:hypothetical protein
MKTSHFLLAAGILLALVFTFSCTSDGNSNGSGGSSVTGGADGGGNQFSQIYNGYYDEDDVYHIGAPYTGGGIIEIASSIGCGSSSNEGNGGCEWNGLKAGSVTNGIVKLELPKNVPEEYLEEDFFGSCSAPLKDIKVFGVIFVLTNSNKEYLGELRIRYMDKQIREEIMYLYFSKAVKGKTTCDDIEFDIDAKAGWNKLYYNRRPAPRKISTNNILTKEMKWMYYNNLDN